MSPVRPASTNGIIISDMWIEEEDAISKEFKFDDFKSALDFVNRVGRLAEKSNHHPDIELGWGRVKVTLTTHSAGKVTQKDLDLSKEIDAL